MVISYMLLIRLPSILAKEPVIEVIMGTMYSLFCNSFSTNNSVLLGSVIFNLHGHRIHD